MVFFCGGKEVVVTRVCLWVSKAGLRGGEVLQVEDRDLFV